MKKIARRLFLSCILPISTCSLFAQPGDEVIIIPDHAITKTAGNEVISFILKIKNQRKNAIDGTLNCLLPEKGLSLITRQGIRVTIPATDSIFVPVKIYAPSKIRAGKEYIVRFSLKEQSSGQILSEGHCSVMMNTKRSVSLYALSTAIQLENNSDSLIIPVRVVNNGNTAENVTVISSLPYTTGGDAFYATRQFNIAAFSDTLVYFRKRVTRRMLQAEGFDASIKGFYTNGELFGVSGIKIQSPRVVRRFNESEYQDSFNGNYLSLSAENTLNPYKSYVLGAYGSALTEGGKFMYSFNATTWRNSGNTPLLRNTWINYQTATVGLKAGNIDKSAEINLNGRGASFFISDSLHTNTIEAGYVEKNYNLIGISNKGRLAPGNAGWLSFSHNKDKFRLNSSLMYDNSPYTYSKSILSSNTAIYQVRGKFRMSASLHGAYSDYSLINERSKISAAGDILVNGRVKKFEFSSSNFLSLPSYPGMRKGTTSLSERVNWMSGSFSVWGNLNYNRFAPQYPSNNTFSPRYENLKTEMGISGPISQGVTLSFAPAYAQDKSNSYFVGNENTASSLKSWNLNTTLNCVISSNQYISLNSESGIYRSSYSPGMKYHLKTNVNYRYKELGIFSSFQKGAFYFGELVNAYSMNKNDYTMLSIGPSIQKDLFHEKCMVTASASYIRSNISGSSLAANSRVEYDVLKHTRLFAGLAYNRLSYNNDHYQTNNLQLGLVQKLPTPGIALKTNVLDVFLYKDVNQNNTYDAGDSIAVNQPLLINQIMFLTGKDGNIHYKNLPAETYTISTPYLKGWYAADSRIYLNKDTRTEIALQKTGALRGQITLSFSELSFEIPRSKAGVVITVTDKEGRSYNTKTNEDGEFSFYLPAGKFTASINPENLRAEIDCLNCQQYVDVSPEKSTTVSFVLKVRNRKLETKKFKSPGLK
ncbi:hypothetical protein BDE36_3169 [Arcticibacter tournemirensis]|uniref:Carboxypeptidase regulatory-like domain-containing protein n=1 Tax=Arcticibacter tournemirensis TaxID=699437 RepID=A0A5M9H9Q0_9SPHI|nr:carboxypeptidase-like regulatory domain-containing protein [Arcticibacter tournemirensis]KAA8483652.1 carboxypeptidase regulatory-like domain-containing protein [Arcticibacter tournemirensis]TQM51391.1 hypothetical protein BDE36_3169 [Arcticibacter tournemirensis]